MSTVEIKHFHLFCGLGGGAAGFNRGHARVGSMEARFRCLGGIDVDPASIRDFQRLTGTPGTVLDLFSREQYTGFHGHEPPADWREATLADIHRAAGGERPNIIFLSAPCKGFSGLLSQKRSTTDKYQALNGLTLRGVWLALEAFSDDPAELIIFENVPRIATRGRHLLDQIVALLRSYGYAVAETTHDCGEIGGLAQSRRRFLLVARHQAKVPAFLYEPTKRPLRAVGEILGRMPLAGDPAGGPMHRIPRLKWKTWVRLAFVEAGSDWRSLNRLAVQDGYLRDYLIVPETYHNGFLGVVPWTSPAGTITSGSRPGNGVFSVADPRHRGPAKHANEFRIVRWDRNAQAVTGARGTGQCVADPRFTGSTAWNDGQQYGVRRWEDSCGTIPGQTTPGQGAYSVADPRIALTRSDPYGVVPWDSYAGAVAGSGKHDNGRFSVADPRLPAPTEHLVAIIRSLDGTHHRPFTTLECAALQGLVDPEEIEGFELDGANDGQHRERIGNAVPRHSATAIADMMGETLLLTMTGQTFLLSSTPVWVRQVAIALSVQQGALP